MRERLWIFFCLDFNKAFDTILYNIFFFCINWLLITWTGVLFTGLETGQMGGPRKWW